MPKLDINILFILAFAVVLLLVVFFSSGLQALAKVSLAIPIAFSPSAIDWTRRWCKRTDRTWSTWRFLPVFIVAGIFSVCFMGSAYSDTELISAQLYLITLGFSFGVLLGGASLAVKEDLRSVSKGIPVKIDKPLFGVASLAAIVAIASMLPPIRPL